MEMLINYILKGIFLPPGGFIFLLIAGLLLLRKFRRTATGLLSVTVIAMYITSTSVFADWLTRKLETYPALDQQTIINSGADAIVVLGAGRYPGAPEYGGDTVSGKALDRLRYGVRLHRITGLPMIVSGGSVFGEASPEAELMKQSLKDDFRISLVWAEGKSRNTAENAFFTKDLLDKHGVKKVFLVTHAWHMPRSVEIFQHAGVDVIPAPTKFSTNTGNKILRWLPNSFKGTRMALHEIIGRLWYRLRY